MSRDVVKFNELTAAAPSGLGATINTEIISLPFEPSPLSIRLSLVDLGTAIFCRASTSPLRKLLH